MDDWFTGLRRKEGRSDDEQRMAIFFLKVAALVLGAIAILGLLIWLFVHRAC